MNKGRLIIIILSFIMIATPFTLTACFNGKDGLDGATWKSGTSYDSFNDAKVGDYFIDTDDYILYQKTSDSWIVVMENYGKSGNNGNDGITPTVTINSEGYWVINGVATTTKAQGPSGLTPTVEINSEGYWVINGVATTTKAQGSSGSTPTVEINSEGYWVINGEPTTTKAQGASGITPTVEINSEGYWVINGVPTATKAQAIDGTNGEDGNKWYVGIEYPTDMNKGDIFLNNSTWDVYQYDGSEWILKGNVKGKDGTSTGTKTSAWSGKTAVFVGDSITAGSGATTGNRYWELLKDYLQFESVTGMGIGGSCISVTSNYGTQYSPLSTRYNSIPEADLIQIFMGTNDYGHDTPLGTIDDTTDISFYGALNVIIAALQQKYPTSRIVFVTPLHRYGANSLTYDYTKNGAGFTLKDYVDAIKEVCERYSVPVIDLFSISGINPSIASVKTAYMPDGIHPNDAGHKLIASLMSNYLELFAPYQSEQQDSSSENTGSGSDNSSSESGSESGDNSGSETGGESNEGTDTSGNWESMGLELGNTYYSSSVIQNRISSSLNVYLDKNLEISLIDSDTYSYFLYKQDGSSQTIVESASVKYYMADYTSDSFVTSEEGWYGVVIARNDDSDFDSSEYENKTLSDFFTIVSIEGVNDDISQVNLVMGNQYNSSGTSLTNRVSIENNIYLNAGTTISLVDNANYKFAVYTQSSKDYSYNGTLITSAFQTDDVSITSNGYYGIVICKADNSTFDFSEDIQNISNYIVLSTSN